MGTPDYAAKSLRALLGSRHRVRVVVTRPDKPRGRGQQMEPSPVKQLALEAGLEVLEPVALRDEAFLGKLRSYGADLGLVVAYGRILPRAALDAPRLGCLNAHASILPQLRGAAPIERAVLGGLAETGVTIMQMNEGLDEGDILFSRTLPIGATTTGAQLREELGDLSAAMLVEAVDLFANSAAPSPVAQDHDAATFAPPLRKIEAALTWKDSAQALGLRIRAFAPRPGAFAFDGKTRLKVLEARVLNQDPGAAPGTVLGVSATGWRVACGDGVLEITILQPEGKRPMSALDYARGLRHTADSTHTLRDGN